MKTKTYGLIAWLLCNSIYSCSAQEPITSPQANSINYSTDPTKARDMLDHLFTQESNYQHLSGVVQIRSADSLIFHQSYGNSTRGISSGAASRFDIGSVSKQFTAAAILMLAHEGHLNLQDKVNPHLGPYASDRWDRVTIHQLLTHTSGIPSIYQTEQGLDIFFPEEKLIEIAELISKFREAKLLFKPGEEFSYSNSGYVLLAAIIEQVSGLPYPQFMEERVFAKYGLEHTGFGSSQADATPYYGYRSDLSSPAPSYHHSWSIGGGGVYSTANDLSRWLSILQSDTFLTASLRRDYLSSHTQAGYGYGWQITKEGRVEHDGGTAGFMSFVSFDPTSGHQIVLLTNRGFEDIHSYGKSARYVRELVDNSWDILKGREVDILPEITSMPEIESEYFLDDGTRITLSSENDTAVWVSVEGTITSRLIANTPLLGATQQEDMMNDLARLLYKKKHWAAAKYFDGEMKFVSYSGLLGIGMKMMRKQTGKVVAIVPYYVEEGHGLMRITGEEAILDIIVYFDEEGKVQGIFEHGSYQLDHEVPMLAYPIGSGELYLDGLNYGEPDATLKLTDEGLTIQQLDRSVLANKL
ncbi:MAG: serine hydrolase domain-containing protein [Cyclobacteriaceae bacterium]